MVCVSCTYRDRYIILCNSVIPCKTCTYFSRYLHFKFNMEIFNYHDIEQRMVCKYHDTCIYLFGKNLLLSNLPVFPLNQGPNIPVILVENCSMIPGNPHWTRANKQFIVLRKEKQVTNQHSQSKCRNSPLI